jgi:hypothetical protein
MLLHPLILISVVALLGPAVNRAETNKEWQAAFAAYKLSETQGFPNLALLDAELEGKSSPVLREFANSARADSSVIERIVLHWGSTAPKACAEWIATLTSTDKTVVWEAWAQGGRNAPGVGYQLLLTLKLPTPGERELAFLAAAKSFRFRTFSEQWKMVKQLEVQTADASCRQQLHLLCWKHLRALAKSDPANRENIALLAQAGWDAPKRELASLCVLGLVETEEPASFLKSLSGEYRDIATSETWEIATCMVWQKDRDLVGKVLPKYPEPLKKAVLFRLVEQDPFAVEWICQHGGHNIHGFAPTMVSALKKLQPAARLTWFERHFSLFPPSVYPGELFGDSPELLGFIAAQAKLTRGKLFDKLVFSSLVALAPQSPDVVLSWIKANCNPAERSLIAHEILEQHFESRPTPKLWPFFEELADRKGRSAALSSMVKGLAQSDFESGLKWCESLEADLRERAIVEYVTLTVARFPEALDRVSKILIDQKPNPDFDLRASYEEFATTVSELAVVGWIKPISQQPWPTEWKTFLSELAGELPPALAAPPAVKEPPPTSSTVEQVSRDPGNANAVHLVGQNMDFPAQIEKSLSLSDTGQRDRNLGAIWREWVRVDLEMATRWRERLPGDAPYLGILELPKQKSSKP